MSLSTRTVDNPGEGKMETPGGQEAKNTILEPSRIPGQSGRFFALSYTWGTATSHNDLCIIQLEDQDFYVRRNLWAFLNRASQHPNMLDVPFFIDALSIDQSNPEERKHQVKLMDRLYSSASEVIIWLGQPQPDDDLLHQGLQVLSRRDDWTLPQPEYRDVESHAIRFIGKCAYWERTWIIQEVLLGNRLRVMLGGYEFPWSKVESLCPKLCPPYELTARNVSDPASATLGCFPQYFLEG